MLRTVKQQIPIKLVIDGMTFLLITTNREGNGEQVVRRPHVTDVLGHSLRFAFDNLDGVPIEMAKLLKALDTASSAVH